MNGFIIIDKPVGMTSHDVVNRVRRITGQKKAGHTGTLDPFATGVLPVALGEATKAIPFLDESVKEYRAVMVFGSATDTQDYTGETVAAGDWQNLDEAQVRHLAGNFVGKLQQMPPMFSAVKHQGTPLYKLARRGVTIERTARDVEIFSLAVDSVALPEMAFTVRCSRGTYVRTLAHDMGDQAGCGAHLLKLRRVSSGSFHEQSAISLEALAAAVHAGDLATIMVSPSASLSHLPELSLTQRGLAAVRHGVAPAAADLCKVGTDSFSAGDVVRLTSGGGLAAVARMTCSMETPGFMRLLRVFNDLCLYMPGAL